MLRSARKGGDEGAQHDRAGVREQLRHLTHAPDILDAVDIREAQIPVQAMAHVVTVQQIGVGTASMQLLLDQIGDGRFARAGETREPHDRGLVTVAMHARALVH